MSQSELVDAAYLENPKQALKKVKNLLGQGPAINQRDGQAVHSLAKERLLPSRSRGCWRRPLSEAPRLLGRFEWDQILEIAVFRGEAERPAPDRSPHRHGRA